MSQASIPVVTIDGPSGAGKGTISRLLAAQLNFHYLDSGALYRLTALAAQRQGVDWNDEPKVAEVARGMLIEFEPGVDEVVVLLNGENVSKDIRHEDMSVGASTVAVHPQVRQNLLVLQRNFQKTPGLVADGRDMGTVVFPQAPAKIYLTASAEARAERRYKQLLEAKLLAPGDSGSLRALLADIQARDERDSQRSSSPLKPADDALVLDSTTLSIDQVMETAMAYIIDQGIRPAKAP